MSTSRLRARECRGRARDAAGASAIWILKVDQRRDGRGNPYFWIGFERLAQIDVPAEGTISQHWRRVIFQTPLRLDRTDEAFSEALTATLK
jgi:5'-nucleotidase